MNRQRSQQNYANPCLTMHQPWASLLVYGIKRVEGRSWPAPIRGRLWIHAASKVPEEPTIRAMEEFYREIYAVNGIADIQFPDSYPVSRLIGCVEVVGCVKREELESWNLVPEGVRLEALTELCWLCENPQKLLVPFEMRGYQRIYNLERKIYEAAVRGLTPVNSPLPVKFPLPNPRDSFSLKPGSLSARRIESRPTDVTESTSLAMAIAGARAAATQFSKKDHFFQTSVSHNTMPKYSRTDLSLNQTTEEVVTVSDDVKQMLVINSTASKEQDITKNNEGSSNHNQKNHDNLKQKIRAPSKLFAMAVKEIKP